MTTSQTTHSEGVIKASSARSSDPKHLWAGHFDFALVGSSWDKRSVAFTSAGNLSFGSIVDIVPAAEGDLGLLAVHHDAIATFSRARGSLHVVPSSPSNLQETLAQVRSQFWSAIAIHERSRPARVFIDISTCPRYFTLALLGEAFRSGVVGEIVMAYAEGKYPDAAPSYDNLEDISFTDGAFQAVPVPGFLGEYEPSKSAFFLVSAGFDGWKTLNLLIRKEPDRVAVLIASPGGAPGYEQRALAANAALFERFAVTDRQTIRAPAGDAVEAWRKISEGSVENFERENTYYLCSGNKAHSVALALRALAQETPTLLYNKPEKHLPTDVSCSGVYWSYSVSRTAGTVFG